jgi:hypothetical protein
MNRKEALEKIKKLVFGEEVPTPAPAPAAPAVFGTEYKLADGNSIMIDKLEVGGIAKIGEEVAPDGVHALEDGTSFEIKEGIIVAVTPKEEEKPAAPIEMGKELEALNKFAENAPAEQQPMVTIVKALFENVFGWQIREAQERATREAAIEVYKTGFEKQKEANQELVKLVEFLAEEPVAKPAQTPVDFEKMTPLERFRFQKQQSN